MSLLKYYAQKERLCDYLSLASYTREYAFLEIMSIIEKMIRKYF